MAQILLAVLRCAWRDAASLRSIQGNNVFYFALLLLLQPESAILLWLLMGIFLAIPALTAPLAKIPAGRLRLWPLKNAEARFLRLMEEGPSASKGLLESIPGMELRQLLLTLDFYFACLLACGGTIYRLLADQPVMEALQVMSLLVVLCLSTLAQNFFGLDGPARLRWKFGISPGASALWRKGRWLLGLSVVLNIGLFPLAALAGAFASLAIGHHNSVLQPTNSPAWRFSSGRFFPHGLLQVVASFTCGIAVAREDFRFLAGSFIVYLFSLVLYGWVWEKV